jgi:hypothetical protein
MIPNGRPMPWAATISAALIPPQARDHDAEGGDHGVAAADGHRDRAGARRHLLDGGRTAVGQDTVELGAEHGRLGDRVRRDSPQPRLARYLRMRVFALEHAAAELESSSTTAPTYASTPAPAAEELLDDRPQVAAR